MNNKTHQIGEIAGVVQKTQGTQKYLFGTIYPTCKENKISNKFKSLIKNWLENLLTYTIYSKLVTVYTFIHRIGWYIPYHATRLFLLSLRTSENQKF